MHALRTQALGDSMNETDQDVETAPQFSLEEEDETMALWPLLYSFLTYGSVGFALYVETGDPGIGHGWPLGAAIVTLLAGLFLERRYRE